MFDKKRCIENIYALAQEKNLKIGEMEGKAGVSKGYLSRINKDDSTTNPTIDFLVSIAEQLNVSLDYLVVSPLKNLSKTESFVMKFIDQLIRRTDRGELDWVLQSKNVLTMDNDEPVDNPLIHLESIDSDMFEMMGRKHHVFKSGFYSKNAVINGDCFNCQIVKQKRVRVFLMSVRYSSFEEPKQTNLHGGRKKPDVYELYICDRHGINPVCSTGYVRDEIAEIVRKLYENVSAMSSHLELSDDARNIMQEFLNKWEDKSFQNPR